MAPLGRENNLYRIFQPVYRPLQSVPGCFIVLENKCVFEFIVLKWIRITFADRGVKRWERFYE